MPVTLTMQDLSQFASSQQAKKTFLNMTGEEICFRIWNALLNQTAFYNVDNETKQIDGLVLFELNYKARIFYVTHFVCLSKKAILNFLDILKKQFSDFTLCARRHNKIVTYNKETLIKKFYNKSLTNKA